MQQTRRSERAVLSKYWTPMEQTITVEEAWEQLFRWGNQVRRATGITAADIEAAIEEYRRECGR